MPRGGDKSRGRGIHKDARGRFGRRQLLTAAALVVFFAVCGLYWRSIHGIDRWVYAAADGPLYVLALEPEPGQFPRTRGIRFARIAAWGHPPVLQFASYSRSGLSYRTQPTVTCLLGPSHAPFSPYDFRHLGIHYQSFQAAPILKFYPGIPAAAQLGSELGESIESRKQDGQTVTRAFVVAHDRNNPQAWDPVAEFKVEMSEQSTKVSRFFVSFATLLPVTGATAAVCLLALGWEWRTHRRRRAQGRCQSCGYDLRASPGRCPECGAGKPNQLNVAGTSTGDNNGTET